MNIVKVSANTGGAYTQTLAILLAYIRPLVITIMIVATVVASTAFTAFFAAQVTQELAIIWRTSEAALVHRASRFGLAGVGSSTFDLAKGWALGQLEAQPLAAELYEKVKYVFGRNH